jgi:alkylation response protein AidB-like acyl-CoA dehydrogenase
METQFDSALQTTFITFEDVEVPSRYMVQGSSIKTFLENFNHERLVFASSSARMARKCFRLSHEYATHRVTFGQRMIEHGVIRAKLGEMIRLVESVQAQVDSVAHWISKDSAGDLTYRKALGSMCALMKVNSTRCFEFCARESSQIFGGASVVKEGRGAEIEGLYREVRAQAIPGGSEEILLDLAIRATSRL